ncbi:MAG: hypothetical protein QGG42_20245, partial [Phycisphaerae bacterium]|nr:hypothetical protein [Phycisphaerae bacterium]
MSTRNTFGIVLTVAAVLSFTSVAGAGDLTIINDGFELPVLADGEWDGAPPGWIDGYYDLAAPTVWVIGNSDAGVYNPSAAEGFGGLAPEGQNVFYATSYVGYDGGASQILSDTLQADTLYDLNILVGNPLLYNGGLTADYRLELVANNVVLASVTGASPADDTVWTSAELFYNSGASPAQLGQLLEIRILATEFTDDYEIDFDTVSLSSGPGATMHWDGDVDEWSDVATHTPDSHWKVNGVLTPDIPQLDTVGKVLDIAIVGSGEAIVAANQGAYSLTINDDGGGGGLVTINSGVTLEIYDATTVTSPGALTINGTLDTNSIANDGITTLGAGAVLKTVSGVLTEIATGGDATFEGGATAVNLNLFSGSTFVKAGGGSLTVTDTGVIDGTNTLQIDGGELRLQALVANPLGGAAVVLGGGRLTTDNGTSMSGSTVSVTADALINSLALNPTATYGALTFDGDGVLSIDGAVTDTSFASTTVKADVTAGVNANETHTILGAVTLENGAQLVTSGDVFTTTIGTVTLSGSSGAIGRSGAGVLAIGSYGGGASKTLTITGGGRTELTLGAAEAVGTKFSIVNDSTLAGTGAVPLGGAAELELGGGTLELTGTTSMTGVATSVIALPAIPEIPPAPAVPSMPSNSILNTDLNPAFGSLTFAGDGVVTTAGASTSISFTNTSVDAGVTGGVVAAEQTVDVGPVTVDEGGVFIGGTSGAGVLNYTSLTLPAPAGSSGGIGGAAGHTFTLHDYNDGGVAKTLLIGGAGTARLDYGGSVTATQTTIKVLGGTLEVSGATPLAGAKGVILA